MIFNSLLNLLNQRLIEIAESSLNPVETLLLRGIWEDATYTEIGQQGGL